MPTARELIEQADALMRRNRAPTERPAGVLHASPMPVDAPVPAPADSRSPVAQHAAPAPVQDATPPAVAQAAPAAALDDVPVLTEAVPLGDAAAPPDDVPVLTDAVEPIEAAPPPDAGAWDLGERGHRDLGPDSMAETTLQPLPPVESPRELPEDVVALVQRWDAQLGLAPAVRTSGADATPEARDAPGFDPAPVAGDPWARAQPPAPDDDAREIDEALGLGPGAAGVPDRRADDEVRLPAPSALSDEDVRAIDASPVGAPPSAPPGEPSLPQAAFGAEGGAAQEPRVGHSPDAATDAVPPAADLERDAQWDAMAEEIRMQVLQRIDIFTDTGLRAQLGERLKPVVDRASADLVATINQHVGDLLRAYVAEAIEREIEKWKRESGPS